jgi:hypothetical protein
MRRLKERQYQIYGISKKIGELGHFPGGGVLIDFAQDQVLEPSEK